MQNKVKEYDAKEMGVADIKLIILGDSAVGKSKYLLDKLFFRFF